MKRMCKKIVKECNTCAVNDPKLCKGLDPSVVVLPKKVWSTIAIDLFGPMSETIIYGLTFVTFLTLILVPIMYYLLYRMKRNIYDKSDWKNEEDSTIEEEIDIQKEVIQTLENKIVLAYLVNFTLAILIYAFLLKMKEKYKEQLGFLFIGGSILKFVAFFIFFYGSYKMDGTISKLEFAAFFTPYILCLIIETTALVKLLNNLK